ncbi:MAG: hypothetical protein EYC62_01325 [Alphaproteobacteria bacterium]|nr:MAG: hypothetical protein EYC62_01325 [Alphaproteobacteria bacterium]
MSWICDVTGYNQSTEKAWLVSRKPQIVCVDGDGQTIETTVDVATDALISHIERQKGTVSPLVLLAYACRADATFKAQQDAPIGLDIFCLAYLIPGGRGWNSHSTLRQFFAQPRNAADFVQFWHTGLSPDQRTSIGEHMVRTCQSEVLLQTRQGHINFNWPLMDRVYQTLVPENMTQDDAIRAARAYGKARDSSYLDQNINSANRVIDNAGRLCTTLVPTAIPYRDALHEVQKRQHPAANSVSITSLTRKLRNARVPVAEK